jgi:hypothetical protein
VSPALLERTAQRGATGTAVVSNTSGRKLRVVVRPRPWRQATSGAVAANRSRKLGGVRVSSTRFKLASGASRSISVRLARVPRRGSAYGALEVVGTPTRRRRGVNVAYRIISSVRFNPTASRRRLSLRAGKARVARRWLTMRVRNRGNTIDAVGGAYAISGRAGGRSGGIGAVRILPGETVRVRVASLSGMRRGRYRAAITLTQAGGNITGVSKRFRIR